MASWTGVTLRVEQATAHNCKTIENAIGRRRRVTWRCVHSPAGHRYQVLETDRGEVFSWVEIDVTMAEVTQLAAERCPLDVT